MIFGSTQLGGANDAPLAAADMLERRDLRPGRPGRGQRRRRRPRPRFRRPDHRRDRRHRSGARRQRHARVRAAGDAGGRAPRSGSTRRGAALGTVALGQLRLRALRRARRQRQRDRHGRFHPGRDCAGGPRRARTASASTGSTRTTQRPLGRGAGDVNGDGIDDLIVGAPGADRTASPTPARAMSSSARPPASPRASISRRSTASNGFRLDGIDAYDNSGFGRGAGDVNGDGIDDLIVGAPAPSRRRSAARAMSSSAPTRLRGEPRSRGARRRRTASASTGSTV